MAAVRDCDDAMYNPGIQKTMDYAWEVLNRKRIDRSFQPVDPKSLAAPEVPQESDAAQPGA